MIVGLLVAVGTTYLVAKPAAEHKVILAADPPKPVPMVAVGDVDNLLNVHGEKLTADLKAAVKQALDDKFPAPAPKGRVLK